MKTDQKYPPARSSDNSCKKFFFRLRLNPRGTPRAFSFNERAGCNWPVRLFALIRHPRKTPFGQAAIPLKFAEIPL